MNVQQVIVKLFSVVGVMLMTFCNMTIVDVNSCSLFIVHIIDGDVLLWFGSSDVGEEEKSTSWSEDAVCEGQRSRLERRCL